MNAELLILLEVLGAFFVCFFVLWKFAFKKLHKLILKIFFGPFLITFSVVTFIFLVQFILKYVDELSGKDVSIFKFAELFFFFSFNLMPQSLPLAIMLSALMTYGNLGQHNELTAIKASGISLLRILTPVFLFVCIIAVGEFYFADRLLPKLNLKAYSLLYDIKKTKPALDVKSGVYYNEIPGYSIFIADKHEDGERIYDVQVYDHSDNRGKVNMVVADSGRMSVSDDKSIMFFDLFSGARYSDYIEGDVKDTDRFIRSEFKETNLVFDLSSFAMNDTPDELFKRDRRMRTVKQLRVDVDSISGVRGKASENFSNAVLKSFRYGLLKDSLVPSSNDLPVLELSKREKKRALIHAMNRASNFKHQLEGKRKAIKRAIKGKNDFLFYLLKKYAEAVACILMFLLGAPVGAIVKKGGLGYPVLLTVIFFIFYYVLTVYGNRLVRGEMLNAYEGVWGPFAVMAPFAIFFLIQARNDSGLFEFSTYKALIKKFFK